MFLAMGKLLFFLILWFLSGVFLLPTLFKHLKPLLTEETLLVGSISLCFLMVYLTTETGFSPALGAFIMGSLLAETGEGHKIERIIKSVKDLFAAIFFVSVGMLIDPEVMIQYAVPIMVITLVTVIGKTLSTATGVLISGRSLRHAVQSGLSLAQIGEFSFIIAGLGLTLKVTSDFLYPVAVGVSAITTFTTPYMIKWADPIFHRLELSLPKSWLRVLSIYNQTAQNTSVVSESRMLFKSYFFRVITNAVLISAIFLGAKRFLLPELHIRLGSDSVLSEKMIQVVGVIIAMVGSAPFFWAIVRGGSVQRSVEVLLKENNRKLVVLLFEVSRWTIAMLLFLTLATQFVSLPLALMLFLGVTILLLLIFSHRLEGIYERLEGQFFKNLSAQEVDTTMPPLAPWDAHLVTLEVNPSSDLVGHTLEQLKIRERFGITIALIERGGRRIPAPNRYQMLFPYDKVFVIGTDEQIHKLSEQVEKNSTHQGGPSTVENNEFNYGLTSYRVYSGSPYVRRSLRDSGIREKFHGLIVGIERQGQRILNPDSTLLIEEGDLLWIVGDHSRVENQI